MHKIRGLTLGMFLLTSSVASASPITYEFTTTWDQGELAGVVSKGRFTYDSTFVQPGKEISKLDLLTSFEFSLRDVRYTENTVRAANAGFDSNGNLQMILFGNNCYLNPAGYTQCEVDPYRDDEFAIGYISFFPKYRSMAGDGPDAKTFDASQGTTTLRLVSSPDTPNDVPEPSAPVLLLSGLGLMGLVGIKRWKQQ